MGFVWILICSKFTIHPAPKFLFVRCIITINVSVFQRHSTDTNTIHFKRKKGFKYIKSGTQSSVPMPLHGTGTSVSI